MAGIEHLPSEIVCLIADMCTLGVYPKLGQYPSSYAKYHARFARTSRRFYTILNPALYKRNSFEDPPVDSCVLWAAGRGRLETMKIAHRLGASLDNNGYREWDDFAYNSADIPGRMKVLAAPLHLAIQNGHRHVVEYLLENGAKVDVVARRFCTENKILQADFQCPVLVYPLHTALVHEHGIEDAPAMLIKRGAYLVAREMHAFPIVAYSGRADLVDLLLDLNEPSVAVEALHYAVATENFDFFQRILARPELNTATGGRNGDTALHIAAWLDDTTFARALLERPEANAAATNLDLFTPLHHAAARGNLPLVELLLQRPEVNPGAASEAGTTALYHAVKKRSVAVVQRLLERPEVDTGARIECVPQTLLQLAIYSGMPELIDPFLQREDFDVTTLDTYGCTLLHYVSESEGDSDGMILLAKKFIDMGVPVNRVAQFGTAFFRAVKCLNFQAALTLLEHDAHPGIIPNDPYGWTILHHCLYGYGPNQTELVARLISLGVDTDTLTTPDALGSTLDDSSSCGSQLFFAAVYAQNIDCMKLLLDAGANADEMVVYTGSGLTFDKLNPGDQQPFLSGLFRHILENLPVHDEFVEEIEEHVCLLLQHGSSLGPSAHGISPFEWGLDAALQNGSFALLELLLNNSSKTNISLSYIEDRIEDYQERNVLDESNRKKAIQMVTQFIEREFAGANSDDKKEHEAKQENGVTQED